MATRKLNVVHICDKFGMRGSTIHGVSRLFAWWFPRHDYSRFNVKLYALKHPDQASRALEADGVQMAYLGRSAFNPLTLKSFLEVIHREKADVLHLHGWVAANYGRLAGRLAGVPTIMHEHGVDPYFPVSQRIADRVLSPLTHTAVGVSKSVRDFLITRRFVSPGKVRIIYNGAPLDEFKPVDDERKEEIRREFGIRESISVIGTIGRLDTQKGITYFLKAARKVKDAVGDVRFIVVGDGPKKAELEQEAHDLGLSEHIIFTGHRTDVPAIQSILDLQVFPSLWEGTPLTIFEAMAMGKAIVSTDVDGLGEVLANGESALIVKPADPDRLAAAIVKLLSDGELATKLGAGARESSRDYDIRRTVQNLEALYEELCRRR